MNYLLVLCFVAVGVFAEPNGPKVTDKVSANDFSILPVHAILNFSNPKTAILPGIHIILSIKL